MVGAGGQLPALAFLREAVSMLVLRYPWRLGNLFIVNSGNIIYYLWLGISRLLLEVCVCVCVCVSHVHCTYLCAALSLCSRLPVFLCV